MEDIEAVGAALESFRGVSWSGESRGRILGAFSSE